MFPGPCGPPGRLRGRRNDRPGLMQSVRGGDVPGKRASALEPQTILLRPRPLRVQLWRDLRLAARCARAEDARAPTCRETLPDQRTRPHPRKAAALRSNVPPRIAEVPDTNREAAATRGFFHGRTSRGLLRIVRAPGASSPAGRTRLPRSPAFSRPHIPCRSSVNGRIPLSQFLVLPP